MRNKKLFSQPNAFNVMGKHITGLSFVSLSKTLGLCLAITDLNDHFSSEILPCIYCYSLLNKNILKEQKWMTAAGNLILTKIHNRGVKNRKQTNKKALFLLKHAFFPNQVQKTPNV